MCDAHTAREHIKKGAGNSQLLHYCVTIIQHAIAVVNEFLFPYSQLDLRASRSHFVPFKCNFFSAIMQFA